MGLCKPVDLSKLPKNLKPEIAERVAEHFKDGVFEFDFSTEEMIAVEGNTVYHVIPYLRGCLQKHLLLQLTCIFMRLYSLYSCLYYL